MCIRDSIVAAAAAVVAAAVALLAAVAAQLLVQSEVLVLWLLKQLCADIYSLQYAP